VSNRRQETTRIKLRNEENYYSFLAKYYLCDQFKTDETSEAHCTNREEVKYVTNFGEET